MLNEDELRHLTDDQRAALLRRLAFAPAPEGVRPLIVPFLVVVTAACLLMIPWTVVLAVQLPPDYVTRRWDLTWVGFDVALTCCLANTAWLAYRRRQLVALWAVITATLLICDAWFDVTTASGSRDLMAAVGSAVALELPLAGLLLWWSRRIITLTIRYNRAVIGEAEEQIRLSRLPLFGIPTRRPPG